MARNNGIEQAKGEYILFVDSDDRLAPNALNILNRYTKNHVDLIIYLAESRRYDDILEKVLPCPQENDIYLQGTGIITKWIFTDFNPYKRPLYSVCFKAFKRNLIENAGIRFREDISLGEDQIFTCRFLQHTNSMYCTNTVLYYLTSWPKDKRSGGLGSCFRTPAEFLYNQAANHQALIKLYEATGVAEVKEYAVNYIMDRPITRILYRHLDEENTERVSFLKLWWFLVTKIVPTIRAEFKNIKLLRDSEIRAYAEKLKKKQYLRVLVEIKRKIKANIIESILSKFYQHRVEIQLRGGTAESFAISGSDGMQSSSPEWLCRDGQGIMLIGKTGEYKLRLSVKQNGRMTLRFRGIDVRGKTGRIPCRVDIAALRIDGTNHGYHEVWHDEPYTTQLDAKAGQTITIEMVTLPHLHTNEEMSQLLEAFFPHATWKSDFRNLILRKLRNEIKRCQHSK